MNKKNPNLEDSNTRCYHDNLLSCTLKVTINVVSCVHFTGKTETNKASAEHERADKLKERVHMPRKRHFP